jgi:hypothetical protein
MRKTLAAIAALSTVALTAPASATEILLDSGSTPYGNGQTTTGSFVFSNDGVTVRASAWSIQGDNTVESETLASWSPGLGIYSGSPNWWGQYSDQHVIDNSGVDEFILLQFDQVVNLSDVRLYTGYDGLYDTDLTVGYATTALSLSNLDEQAFSYLGNDLGLSLYNVNDVSNGHFDSIGSGTNTGNLWLIGGKFGNSNDGFKLNALKFTTTPAVPEPSTWLMMILGFGLVGGVMRAKRRENLSVSYS